MLLSLATVLVFAAHLLAVNLAMAGPLLCVWLEWRGARRSDEAARRLELSLARWSLAAFVAGVLLGAVLLGLLWVGEAAAYFAAIRTLPADRLGFAAGELLFYLACQGCYCRLARRRWLAATPAWSTAAAMSNDGRLTTGPPRRGLSRLLGLAAASNLMYHFPALFAMLAVIRSRPELWDRTLDRGLYHALLFDPQVFSRMLHVWLAAVATAGLVLMWRAARLTAVSELSPGTPEQAAPAGDTSTERRVAATGACGALAATLAQMPVGLWVLFELPGPAAAPLWDGDVLVLAMLAGAVALSMWLLQQLAGAALGDCQLAAVHRCLWTTAAVVLLMCGVVERLQRLTAPVDSDRKSQAADPR